MSAVTGEGAKPFDLVDDIESRSKGQMSYPLEAPELEQPARKAHASPIVRTLARHLGVDLNRVKGSGPNERVLEIGRAHV